MSLQIWGSVVVGVLSAISVAAGARLAVTRLNRDPQAGMTRGIAAILGFAAGAFLAAVCLDVLPDALADGKDGAWWVLVGAGLLWLASLASDRHFAREPQTDGGCLWLTRTAAWVLAAALSLHTFFEGAAVSLTLSTPNAAAWGFALAVVLHKLPEGVVWGLALGAAFPEDLVRLPRILLVPGLCTLIGVLLGLGFAQLADAPWIHAAFGIAAGAVLYIGFGELLPGLREVGMVQPRTVCGSWLLGMLVMAALVAVAASLGGAA